MHKEYHGSGDSIMLSGLKLLRKYPKHDRVEGLAAHLGGWENMFDEYGSDLKTLSPHMLRSLIVDIIPTSFEDVIVTRPEINTCEQILKYCRDQADDRRVKWLANAWIKNHNSGGKINSLIEDDVPPPPSRHSESRPDRRLDDEAPARAKGLIHAITQSKGSSRPRSPSPT